MLDAILYIIAMAFLPYLILLIILSYIGTTLPSLINLVLIYLGIAAIIALPVSMIYKKKKTEEYARKHSNSMKKF